MAGSGEAVASAASGPSAGRGLLVRRQPCAEARGKAPRPPPRDGGADTAALRPGREVGPAAPERRRVAAGLGRLAPFTGRLVAVCPLIAGIVPAFVCSSGELYVSDSVQLRIAEAFVLPLRDGHSVNCLKFSMFFTALSSRKPWGVSVQQNQVRKIVSHQ